MASQILDKYSASTALTITLASLASSTTFVGRQSDMIDNSTTRYSLIHIFGKIKQGTTPTGNKGVYLFAIRGDAHGTPHRSDNAGASDAAWTRANAEFLNPPGRNLASPSTGDLVFIEAFIVNPGPSWGVGLYHDTVAALDSTGSNHWLRWIGNNPELQ